jgi:hypothetical protein
MAKRITARQNDRRAEVGRAILDVLAREKWSNITLASVARAAKLPLTDVLAIVPSKTSLPGLILKNVARQTMHRHKAAAASENPRERLFDVTMTWFDTQQSHASALKKLYRALQYDPATLLAMRGNIADAAGELLALAEADFGLSARLQAAIFAGVLVRATSVWRDDDEEMGRTMAQLERDLRRLERFFWPKPGTAGVSPASPQAKKVAGTAAVPGNKHAAAPKPVGGLRHASRQGGSNQA